MADAAETESVLYQRGGESDPDTWDDSALIKAYDEAVSAMKVKMAEQNPEFSPLVSNSKNKKKKKSRGKNRKRNNSIPVWKAGDRCQAVYTEDGEVYEARIMGINKELCTCTVQYIGYGNEEDQPLDELMPAGCLASSQRTETASETESINPEPMNHTELSTERIKSKKSSKGQSKSRKIGAHQELFRQWNGQMPVPPTAGQMPPPPPPLHPHFQPPQFHGYQPAGPSAPQPPAFPNIPPPPPLFTQRGSGDENEAMYSMLMSWYMSGYHTGYYQGLKQASSNASGASAHGSYR